MIVMAYRFIFFNRTTLSFVYLNSCSFHFLFFSFSPLANHSYYLLFYYNYMYYHQCTLLDRYLSITIAQNTLFQYLIGFSFFISCYSIYHWHYQIRSFNCKKTCFLILLISIHSYLLMYLLLLCYTNVTCFSVNGIE
jgi:hypothetical protein